MTPRSKGGAKIELTPFLIISVYPSLSSAFKGEISLYSWSVIGTGLSQHFEKSRNQSIFSKR